MAKFLELENVEQVARSNPDTFFIPSADERKRQKIGASIRLHFLLKDPSEKEARAERMWVTVTQEQGLFKPYKGVLQNQPVYIEDITLGDEITFQPCHIARTLIKQDDPRWVPCAEMNALVSKRCFAPGECVRFLYREQTDREGDSGWAMFTGHESPVEQEDPNSFRIVEVDYMLDKDPSLLEPLKAEVGAVFERESKAQPWKRVTDWTPGE
jgi:hypothetical protein